MKILDHETLKYWGKVTVITLLLVLVLRGLFFEFFTISTSQMESALMEGDEVLVSKLSYGPRLPITPITIPFTHDKFLGVKSYSSLIKLPYFRLFRSEIEKNDIVLFNSPISDDVPLDKRDLLISRCVALPGDTVKIQDGIYYINQQQYVQSPTLISEYVASKTNADRLFSLINQLQLEVHKQSKTADSLYFTLSRYDAFILSKYATADMFHKKQEIIPETLIFIIPSKGRGVMLSPRNIKFYRHIIESEQGKNVRIEGNDVYINNQKSDVYYFSDDYYWLMSDNTVDAKDSRDLGFIPFRNVIGKVKMVLYSRGKTGLRADRFLMPVQ